VVLFEAEEKDGLMFGFTDNYIKVQANYDPLLINELAPVELISIAEDGSVKCEFDYAVHGH
jgi:threonylcarbamoyladenosine tRNA methylthiotransferase MtaB